MKNRDVILQQAEQYNSFYLYDEATIRTYTQALKEHFPNITFLYSLKTNPFKPVVQTVFSEGFGADAASLAEVQLSSHLGLPKNMVQYSAPGKLKADIEAALDKAIIIADSLHELQLIEEIAAAQNKTVSIGVRINPNFTFTADKGTPSKFGIDEEVLFAHTDFLQNLNHVEIIGIHVHLRSQELNAQIIKSYYEKMFTLAQKVQQHLAPSLQFVNMGSGLGIPYAEKDSALDITYLGAETTKLANQFKQHFPNINIFIETGRYAVGKSGIYATKAIDIKESGGTKFVILNNTLNGFIRPSLAQLVMHYSHDENPAGSEPLFTSKDAFTFQVLNDATEQETVTLVGNLCTATDVIAKSITLPKMELNDVIVINNAGSYAAVISPMQFSSLVPPAQLFLSANGYILSE